MNLPDRIVLYDGDCAVCDATVKWLIARDRTLSLSYASLQGETAAALRLRHPEWPQDLDSIVLVRTVDGTEQLSWYSTGFLAILSELPAPWRYLALLRVLPTWIRDSVYRIFARYRKHIFGDATSCALPTPEQARRILP